MLPRDFWTFLGPLVNAYSMNRGVSVNDINHTFASTCRPSLWCNRIKRTIRESFSCMKSNNYIFRVSAVPDRQWVKAAPEGGLGLTQPDGLRTRPTWVILPRLFRT